MPQSPLIVVAIDAGLFVEEFDIAIQAVAA